MAPMTAGLLLVYEIPDSGGRGHRLVIPAGSDLPAEEAATLIASIRGPVHLAADRLGIVRPSMQRSPQGAVRDCSAVALIAGIDVRSASASTVVSALAMLDDSLDAVTAEAADTVSVNDAPLFPSPAADRVLESIVALGFRDAPVAPGLPATSATTEQRPRETRLIADVLLLFGTLTVLATGFAIGWAARDRTSGDHADRSVADPGRHDSTPSQRDTQDGKAPTATTSVNQEFGPPNLAKPLTDPPGSDSRPVTEEPRTGAGTESFPEQSPAGKQPQPASEPDSVETDTAITFHVECKGTAPGDRIQLLRRENKRPIGRGALASENKLCFDEKATDGISSPEQLAVQFSRRETPKALFGAESDTPIEKDLTLRPESKEYVCVIEFTPANPTEPRRIEVTVSTHSSAD